MPGRAQEAETLRKLLARFPERCDEIAGQNLLHMAAMCWDVAVVACVYRRDLATQWWHLNEGLRPCDAALEFNEDPDVFAWLARRDPDCVNGYDIVPRKLMNSSGEPVIRRTRPHHVQTLLRVCPYLLDRPWPESFGRDDDGVTFERLMLGCVSYHARRRDCALTLFATRELRRWGSFVWYHVLSFLVDERDMRTERVPYLEYGRDFHLF